MLKLSAGQRPRLKCYSYFKLLLHVHHITVFVAHNYTVVTDDTSILVIPLWLSTHCISVLLHSVPIRLTVGAQDKQVQEAAHILGHRIFSAALKQLTIMVSTEAIL